MEGIITYLSLYNYTLPSAASIGLVSGTKSLRDQGMIRMPQLDAAAAAADRHPTESCNAGSQLHSQINWYSKQYFYCFYDNAATTWGAAHHGKDPSPMDGMLWTVAEGLRIDEAPDTSTPGCTRLE